MAWRAAQALAALVLGDEAVVLAEDVLAAGPFAMRRAEALAELVLVRAVAASPSRSDSVEPDGGAAATNGNPMLKELNK